MHDLDAPWRPGDLRQRSGRIERQGNMNKTAYVYRYVTENTFDAYLWQTLENKQKFISQVMTSKSPVRSCDDLDETSLSFAEVKALCAGDPKIKEKMDLDIEVAKLKLLKANYKSIKYQLENKILRYFPENITAYKGYIKGFEKDIETLAKNTPKEDEFLPMSINGNTYSKKEIAGDVLLDSLKNIKNSEEVELGSYRSFKMFVSFDSFENAHRITLKGAMSHSTTLSTSASGNLTRIDNALNSMPRKLDKAKDTLQNFINQKANAEIEVTKPFSQEQEFLEKAQRLVQLDIELSNPKTEAEKEVDVPNEKATRPSVLAQLKNSEPRVSSNVKSKKPSHELR